MYGQTAVGNDGMTKGCVGNDYQPCDNNAATECVGKEADNYVYKLVEPGETCDNFGILKLTLSFPILCQYFIIIAKYNMRFCFTA